MFIHELGKYFEDCTEGELLHIGYTVEEQGEETLCDPREALSLLDD